MTERVARPELPPTETAFILTGPERLRSDQNLFDQVPFKNIFAIIAQGNGVPVEGIRRFVRKGEYNKGDRKNFPTVSPPQLERAIGQARLQLSRFPLWQEYFNTNLEPSFYLLDGTPKDLPQEVVRPKPVSYAKYAIDQLRARRKLILGKVEDVPVAEVDESGAPQVIKRYKIHARL